MEITGLNRNFILSILKRNNILPVGLGDKNGKLWDDSVLEIIRKENPDTSDLWTAWKISETLGISPEKAKRELEHYIPTLTLPTGTYYSDLVFRQIKNRVTPPQVKLKKENPEDHPLVTDHRWLDPAQWPDIIPKGWEEYWDGKAD